MVENNDHNSDDNYDNDHSSFASEDENIGTSLFEEVLMSNITVKEALPLPRVVDLLIPVALLLPEVIILLILADASFAVKVAATFLIGEESLQILVK
eukprot:195980-Ditylum_brightwellii.AAC.1